jgi:uncharacterized ion transporter superfamily protein YfcC
MKSFKLPSPITILMLIIILAAACTWVIPSGKYARLESVDNKSFLLHGNERDSELPFTQKTLDSLQIKIPLFKFENQEIKKPVAVPNSYYNIAANKQGAVNVLLAPIKGIYESVDIIFFVLLIGAFMQVFNQSGAMDSGVYALSQKMKGREKWLIIILTFLFSFGGASYGMAEEGFAFYALLTPIFLAAGYDAIVPLAVIFGGTQLGTLSSFSNPFSTIIASNAAGINWVDGIAQRLLLFGITTTITIWYIVAYANKVKKDPSKSLLYGTIAAQNKTESFAPKPLTNQTSFLLLLFAATFGTMIFGVIKLGWWLPEMTAVFLVASILTALILRMKESDLLGQFLKGAESLLSVAIIIGVARGITIILNDANISDSIVHFAASKISSMPPSLFILSVFAMYILFTLFISSSSGMAVLTMPIIATLASIVHVPGNEIVNAYLFGMGIMGFVTPSGLILPSLAITNVSIKAWFKFITPLLLMLAAVCVIALLIGINIS